MKVVSSGQTGADRAGLAWAMKNGIPHGDSGSMDHVVF
ncbi:MAG: putative molybdenum carrier protein [Verrucomicrobiota bacterium]